MGQKQLTLRISGKIETDEHGVMDFINGISVRNFLRCIKGFELDSVDIDIDDVDVSAKFDWEATTEIATPKDDDYYKIADELYSRLINDISRFSDWEYKFISDMYSYIDDKRSYSAKQREWINKLEVKYL